MAGEGTVRPGSARAATDTQGDGHAGRRTRTAPGRARRRLRYRARGWIGGAVGPGIAWLIGRLGGALGWGIAWIVR